jgi:hypothetical protein
VATRLAPSARLEAAIEELLAGGIGDEEKLAEIGRLEASLVLQKALEAEVAEFLNRGRYQRLIGTSYWGPLRSPTPRIEGPCRRRGALGAASLGIHGLAHTDVGLVSAVDTLLRRLAARLLQSRPTTELACATPGSRPRF